MARNLIQNGNFETGDFLHWSVDPGDGKASVVTYKSSYRAEVKLGKHQTVMLDTGRFNIGSKAFTLNLQASMPESTIPEETHDPALIQLLACTLFGWGPSQPAPIYFIPFLRILTRKQAFIELSGTMKEGVEEVQLIIGLPSRTVPKEAGPIYIDNVKYLAEPLG